MREVTNEPNPEDMIIPAYIPKPSREWTPMDNYNSEYLRQLQVHCVQSSKVDYIEQNKVSDIFNMFISV